ncbi:kelch-like protein 23 [Arctopsyche grandis]|uniref:kelch-like protein 23 n=1 Tax=Arctopsyche grandis TaxID=121162 RepID=UPI00406D836F
MNKKRFKSTSVIINERIFVIGGVESVYIKPKVFDTVEESSHASVIYKGKIYVFGGHSASRDYLSSVEVYDPNANRWTELSPMKWKRSYFTAVVVNDSIYCIGGVYGLFCIGQVEKFDPSSNRWTEVSNMPVKDSGFQAIYHNEKIICFGGWSNGKIQVYDPAKNTWEIIGKCPNQRRNYIALILERSF